MNNPDSQTDVVTTIGPVLAEFIRQLKIEMPDVAYVYDENLSYETAVKKFRDDNNLSDNAKKPLPLFAFRRTVLRHVRDGAPGKRAVSLRASTLNVDLPTSTDLYRIVHGEYDVEFLYITKDINRLETFEVAYLSEEGFTGTKELIVSVPTLNDFKYHVNYQEALQSKTIQDEENYHKAVSGVFTMRGFFPVFKTTAPHILQLNINVSSYLIEINESILLDTIEIQ